MGVDKIGSCPVARLRRGRGEGSGRRNDVGRVGRPDGSPSELTHEPADRIRERAGFFLSVEARLKFRGAGIDVAFDVGARYLAWIPNGALNGGVRSGFLAKPVAESSEIG